MTVVGIDHVQLAMPAGEEARAREFYGHLLGFAEVTKPPQLVERGGCWFENGEVRIHLGVEPEFHPAKKAHPALLVAGLKDLVGQLRAAGYSVEGDEPLPGVDRIYASDPFGNRIELIERTL